MLGILDLAIKIGLVIFMCIIFVASVQTFKVSKGKAILVLILGIIFTAIAFSTL